MSPVHDKGSFFKGPRSSKSLCDSGRRSQVAGRSSGGPAGTVHPPTHIPTLRPTLSPTQRGIHLQGPPVHLHCPYRTNVPWDTQMFGTTATPSHPAGAYLYHEGPQPLLPLLAVPLPPHNTPLIPSLRRLFTWLTNGAQTIQTPLGVPRIQQCPAGSASPTDVRYIIPGLGHCMWSHGR